MKRYHCPFLERVTICEGGVDFSDSDDEDESKFFPIKPILSHKMFGLNIIVTVKQHLKIGFMILIYSLLKNR